MSLQKIRRQRDSEYFRV